MTACISIDHRLTGVFTLDADYTECPLIPCTLHFQGRGRKVPQEAAQQWVQYRDYVCLHIVPGLKEYGQSDTARCYGRCSRNLNLLYSVLSFRPLSGIMRVPQTTGVHTHMYCGTRHQWRVLKVGFSWQSKFYASCLAIDCRFHLCLITYGATWGKPPCAVLSNWVYVLEW